MENPEEILHSLEEFSKLKPKDIPRELEDYLCFVAKTGDPVYQWSAVKSLFREKLINVITEFYESCPTVEIPPCPNVEMFNYDSMKNFILEKLDTFAAAPFTVQRICELLTTPRKEYNRIDKYMRALEKNILVVSTTEPANRRNTENGEGIVNGIETEHLTEANSSNDINVEEMDDSPSWPRINQQETSVYGGTENGNVLETQPILNQKTQDSEHLVAANESRVPTVEPSTSNTDSVITCTAVEKPFISIEPIVTENPTEVNQDDVSVTITAIPAPVQKRRDSIEPLTTDDNAVSGSVNSNKEEEEPVKEVSEQHPEVSKEDEANKSDFENCQTVIENDNEVNENEIDGKAIDENSVDIQKVEEKSNEVKEEEIKTTCHLEEDPVLNTISQNEPEIQEICDNTQSTQNTETCVDDSDKKPSESASVKIPEETVPNNEQIETDSKSEETVICNDDNIDHPTKEPCEEDNTSHTAEETASVSEEPSEEAPMEVDSDVNLIKEPVADISSIETNLN